MFHTISPISSEKSLSTGGLSHIEWQMQVSQNPICVQKLKFIINNKTGSHSPWISRLTWFVLEKMSATSLVWITIVCQLFFQEKKMGGLAHNSNNLTSAFPGHSHCTSVTEEVLPISPHTTLKTCPQVGRFNKIYVSCRIRKILKWHKLFMDLNF